MSKYDVSCDTPMLREMPPVTNEEYIRSVYNAIQVEVNMDMFIESQKEKDFF